MLRSLLLPVLLLAVTGCGGVMTGSGTPAGAMAAGHALARSSRAIGPGIDELFAAMTVGSRPGAAVVVLDGGKVVHQKGYGLADLTTKRPVDANTVFDLASVSKSFTALAVMTLAEQGKLAYDDPVIKFIPQFTGDARKITIRHLLNHTSGLQDYMGLYVKKVKEGGWAPDFEPTSLDALGLLTAEERLEFEPGSAYAYSNSGYVVLAQVVARASGQRFPAYMKSAVLRPLGMNDSQVYDELKPTDPKRAKSYKFQNGQYENIDYTALNLIYGDGNLNTSIADMAKSARAYEPGVLLKATTLKQAVTPPNLAGGGVSHYGFGLLLGNSGTSEPYLMHNGAWVGFRTAFITMPGKHRTAIVLANSAGTSPLPLANEIMLQLGK